MKIFLNGVEATAADLKDFLEVHYLRVFVKNGSIYIEERVCE